jgi:predicted NAD/FAD-dependent oxidoreductase
MALRGHNAVPTLFDAGRQLGGRLTGAQFLTASPGSRFQQVLEVLRAKNVIAPWNARFGVIGSRGGGFLPKEVVDAGALERLNAIGRANGEGAPELDASGGDFCGFISRRTGLFVGTPSNLSVCAALVDPAIVRQQRVSVIRRVGAARWAVGDADSSDEFDAIVFAVHDPSLAALTVRHLVESELADTAEAAIRSRMLDLADTLQALRSKRTAPLFTLQASLETDARVPFDAAIVPTSALIQFVAREASKPGRADAAGSAAGELWTAVSTVAFAREMLRDERADMEDVVAQLLCSELSRLFAP